MAFPFSDIMRVRLARVLIMRVIMRNFMRRVCLIMRGAFSPSKALPTYYARASGPRFEYERVYAQHYARSSLDYVRWSVGWYRYEDYTVKARVLRTCSFHCSLDIRIASWRLTSHSAYSVSVVSLIII